MKGLNLLIGGIIMSIFWLIIFSLSILVTSLLIALIVALIEEPLYIRDIPIVLSVLLLFSLGFGMSYRSKQLLFNEGG